MIANADIDLWVQAAGANFSYSQAYGPLRSDGLGLFEAAVPESEISLVVESDDFVHLRRPQQGVTGRRSSHRDAAGVGPERDACAAAAAEFRTVDHRNLPADTYVEVSKAGFKSRLVGPIDGTEPAVLEIVLEREIPDPFDECEDWGCP